MIQLFTGNPYMIDRKLRERKDNFTSKFGKQNIYIYKDINSEYKSISDVIWGGGLFVDKKLIVIYGIPASTDGKITEAVSDWWSDIMDHIDHISDDNIICLVSPKPDSRTKLYKTISTHPSVKHQDCAYQKSDIYQMIQNNIPNISTNNMDYIIAQIGEDLYAIDHETYKLGVYLSSTGVAITRQLIDDIIIHQPSADAFKLLSYIYDHHYDQIISTIATIQSIGDNFWGFLGAIYRSIRASILYHRASTRSSDSKTIISLTKLPPVTVYTLAKRDNNAMYDLMTSTYHQLITLEKNIKTGLIAEDQGRLHLKKILTTDSD